MALIATSRCLWVAVDEHDAALTPSASLWSVSLQVWRARLTHPAHIPSHRLISGVPGWPPLPPSKEEPATRFAKDQLKAIIERIERLEEEKKTISDDIRDVFAEAKGNGYDVKALRTIVRMRKQDANERQEQETILETYMQALGCCERAAVSRERIVLTRTYFCRSMPYTVRWHLLCWMPGGHVSESRAQRSEAVRITNDVVVRRATADPVN